MRFRLFACVIVGILVSAPAFAQNDRRDRQNPELIVESGGRLGSCDSLQFTSDGKYLLAIGDDKVVRIWPYRDGKLQTEGMQVLRWSIWREQRGAIFALALSPDKENKHVAVAGYGQPTSTVAILERATGKMLYRVVAIPPKGEYSDTIWSLAFAPDGSRVAFGDSYGGVWTWDFTNDAQRLGKHNAGGEKNIVRFVHFFDDNTLVSVAEDGSARRWDFPAKPGESVELKHFDNSYDQLGHFYRISRVALSPDKQWFAAAVKGPRIIVRSVDGKQSRKIDLKVGEFARAVAFDIKSERLVATIARLQDGATFYMDGDDRVVFYDLKRDLAPTEGPGQLFRAWFFAFHPDGKDVAIAAGENNEVTLWNLAKMDKPVSVMGGAGKSLWDVALSKDGNQIGFRDQRNPKSVDPNARADGPWRVFHMPRRDWTNPADFKPVEQFRRWEGWSVQPDTSNPYLWYAVTPQGRKLPLTLSDDERDGMPRCYLFLPPVDKQPLRLAVGHLWGLSIFELTPTAAKRVRLCTGHQADVTALAVSADGSFLVSASMDQTISGWNIATNWDSQATLGASFEVKDDRLFVKNVDVGSPAWETGLVAGDEVESFHFDGDPKPLAGGPREWQTRLQNPVPGTEHGFRIRRAGKPVFSLATFVRQRPLWRFFPTSDGEWVLWMWQNSFYDTSTKGDSYIGWHVNAPDLAHEPTFYRAEQFRKIYERPGVLDKLLQTNDVRVALREALGANPLPLQFNTKEPPLAVLTLAAETTNKLDVKATLTATPQGTNPDFQPQRVEVWINDFRLFEDKQPDKWNKTGAAFDKSLTIPNVVLRPGDNVVTFQVYNFAGGRSEVVKNLRCTRPPLQPQLFGLAVGVNNYGNVKAGPGNRGKLEDLVSACNDAEQVQKCWLAQKTLYQGTDMFLNLDAKANHADIIDALDLLAKKVGPEDTCVLFLAGHGIFVEHKAEKDQAPTTTWLFCCPDFDLTRPEETGITSEILYAKLAAIKGRKLVILDACHSGEAAANPVRSLVPGGQGPVIMASCDRNQSSFEDAKKLKHGLFTYALLEAMDPKIRRADPTCPKEFDKKELDARDLYTFTRGRMPDLLKRINATEYAQVPILFAPQGKLFPVVTWKN